MFSVRHAREVDKPKYFGNARPPSTMTEPSMLCVTLLLTSHPHTERLNWLVGAEEIAYDGRQGRCWGGVRLIKWLERSSTEMLSSILQITSSLGFIFVLELILNIPLCSLFITYCPLLLVSSFITGDLSQTFFLSVTLFIVRQGFWRLAVAALSLKLLCNEDWSNKPVLACVLCREGTNYLFIVEVN